MSLIHYIIKLLHERKFLLQIWQCLVPNLKAATTDPDAWEPYPATDKYQVQVEWLLISSCAYEHL